MAESLNTPTLQMVICSLLLYARFYICFSYATGHYIYTLRATFVLVFIPGLSELEETDASTKKSL